MEKLKRCAKCKDEKPHSEFTSSKIQKDGKYPYCNICNREHVKAWRLKDPERAKERQRASYKKYREIRIVQSRERYMNNKPALNNARWKSLDGITLDEAKALLAQQGGVCKLCRQIPKKPCVDHCHT